MVRQFPLDDRTLMVVEVSRRGEYLVCSPYNLTDSVPATRRALAALFHQFAEDLNRRADEFDSMEAKP